MEAEIGILRGPRFPTIDLKFANAGNKAAILSRIEVLVEKAQADLSPWLRCYPKVMGRADADLRILAENTGWGAGLPGPAAIQPPLFGRAVPAGGTAGGPARHRERRDGRRPGADLEPRHAREVAGAHRGQDRDA
jgi:hypothetical protein